MQPIAVALAGNGYDIWLNYGKDHGRQPRLRRNRDVGSGMQLLPFRRTRRHGGSVEPRTPARQLEHPLFSLTTLVLPADAAMVWMTGPEWSDVISVALDGFFNVTNVFCPVCCAGGPDCIINIVSTSGESGMAGQVNYASAKAGLIGATKSLAKEVGEKKCPRQRRFPRFY